MTSVTRSLPDIVVEFRMGEKVMNSKMVRVSVAGLVLLRRLGLLCVLITLVICFYRPLFADAPTISGRVSREQMHAILAAADQEGQQAFSDLVQQTTVLPTTLLSIQEQARRWGRGSNPCLQKISSFQGRLGQSLHPKQVEDIVALNQLLSRTVDGQVNYCRGQFQSLTNSDCFALFTSVSTAVDVEEQRQQQIGNAKTLILQVEGALDGGDLIRANQLYLQLANSTALPHFAQTYLQQTQTLGLDLSSYAQAAQFDHRRDVPLLQQVLTLGREVSMLSAFESGRPLTKKYLQDAITNDTEAVRIKLASLPTFQFNETSYRVPSDLSENDKLAFVLSHLKDVDNSLAPVSETRAIVAQPDAVKTLEEVVGGNEAARLNATAGQIAAAEHVRASLVEAQNSIQAKITAEKEARERRIAEVEERKAAENEARERRIAEAQEAERERLARIERQRPTIERFASQLKVIRGRRFKVMNAGVGDEILQDMLDKIPKQQLVDLIAMYEAMEGLDGSTTLQGLARSRASFIGKYYMLQGDVFQIQADRDYPLDGLNEFAMFGQVNLVGNTYIPVNVECISTEKVPPYQLSPVLGKISDFKLGTNRAGKSIIIPVVQVVAVLGTHNFSKENEEIIINQQ